MKKQGGHSFLKVLRYILLLCIITVGLMTIVGTGGGGGGGSSNGGSATSYATEYRGTYVNTENPSDSGTWSMKCTQNGSSVPAEVTDDDGNVNSGTFQLVGDTLTSEENDTTFTLIIKGNDLTGTLRETGDPPYNVSATLYDGPPLVANTMPSPLIGGTPVDGNPPVTTDDADTPVASSLSVSPVSVSSGDQITIELHFDDTDANVTKLGIHFMNETRYFSYDTSSVTSGFVSFDLDVSDIIGNYPAGTYPLGVFIEDGDGNVSNYLYSTVNVAGTGGVDKITMQEYWVLGDSNVYNYTGNGQISVSSTTFPPYITESVFELSYFENGSLAQALYLDYDANGFLCHYGEVWESGNCGITKSIGARLPSVMEIGKEYALSYVMDVYNTSDVKVCEETDRVTAKISGPVLVSTPAGNFSAYKLEMNGTWSDTNGDSDTWTTYFWLAKNIGIVQLEDNGGIHELESATVNGTNY